MAQVFHHEDAVVCAELVCGRVFRPPTHTGPVDAEDGDPLLHQQADQPVGELGVLGEIFPAPVPHPVCKAGAEGDKHPRFYGVGGNV